MATKRYFIVNPAGAIHEVDYDHAQERLKQPGYRSATKAEVKKLQAAGGNQRFDQPICEPFKATPVAIEIEDFEEEAPALPLLETANEEVTGE